ncbi:MAG TPA: hypothetical protein VG992_00565 [Candidatus Saccharimonadales bacterium]|nr:hypothetical protein [Candidatus Saccharimonadales bacterium]
MTLLVSSVLLALFSLSYIRIVVLLFKNEPDIRISIGGTLIISLFLGPFIVVLAVFVIGALGLL